LRFVAKLLIIVERSIYSKEWIYYRGCTTLSMHICIDKNYLRKDGLTVYTCISLKIISCLSKSC